ncbi:Ovochymase-2 [Manis javanica]|nr:Ovochymase-2 [Manis javanica]
MTGSFPRRGFQFVDNGTLFALYSSADQDTRGDLPQRYTANLRKGDLSDAGCRSLTVLFEEGLIQSLHYPENYSDLAACSWVFQAPRRYLIKLSFQNLEIEESGDCTSDYVTVHRDVERKKEVARLCGFAAPVPVLSSSGVMFISFQSDENVTFRGFQASVSFIPETDVNISGSEDEPMFLETWSTS